MILATDLVPYPHLDADLLAAVRKAYEHLVRTGDAISAEELRFALRPAPREVLERAVKLELLCEHGNKRLPTVLGLLYLPEAEGDLSLIDQLVRLGHRLYRPGAAAVPEQEILQAVPGEAAALRRAARLADHLGIGITCSSGGAVELQPNEEGGRFESLAAVIQDRYRGPRAEAAAVGAGPWPRPGPFGLRVTGLRARNFRALRDVVLPLPGGLTALVGPNASGKSTVMDLLAFVGRAVDGGLDRALQAEGGFGRLRTRGAVEPLAVEVDFDLDVGAAERRIGRYRFALAERGEEVMLDEETLDVADAAGAPVRWLEASRAVARFRTAGGDTEEHFKPVASLALPLAGAAHPLAQGIRQDLASQVLLDRDPIAVLRAGEGPLFGLGRSTGRRPAPPLRALLTAAAATPAGLDRLARLLAELVPAVTGIRRVAATGEPVELEVEERDTPGASRLDELSAGTRQMLWLAALHVMAEPPRTILLEEPDTALHVGSLPALVDLLRSLARRSVVIVTTHSPALVGCLDPALEVVALERDAGGVQARTLAQALGSRRWLAAFGSTAEAFTRAASERRP